MPASSASIMRRTASSATPWRYRMSRRTPVRAVDQRVTVEAARHIRRVGPARTWVYLQYTDDMGHDHGDSEAFDAAVRGADAMVGRITHLRPCAARQSVLARPAIARSVIAPSPTRRVDPLRLKCLSHRPRVAEVPGMKCHLTHGFSPDGRSSTLPTLHGSRTCERFASAASAPIDGGCGATALLSEKRAVGPQPLPHPRLSAASRVARPYGMRRSSPSEPRRSILAPHVPASRRIAHDAQRAMNCHRQRKAGTEIEHGLRLL
jgi:hypothetical protein